MRNETQFQDNSSTDRNKKYTAETNEKITDVFNTLIQINNDRIEGYGLAAKETDETDLKRLFNGMAAKSHMLKHHLADEVRKYGGKPTESTTTLGKIYRIWMDFKATLSGKNRKAILLSCEFGEDAAQEAYADAIKKSIEQLPAYIIQLLIDQKAELREDHNRVKLLLDRE